MCKAKPNHLIVLSYYIATVRAGKNASTTASMPQDALQFEAQKRAQLRYEVIGARPLPPPWPPSGPGNEASPPNGGSLPPAAPNGASRFGLRGGSVPMSPPGPPPMPPPPTGLVSFFSEYLPSPDGSCGSMLSSCRTSLTRKTSYLPSFFFCRARRIATSLRPERARHAACRSRLGLGSGLWVRLRG